MNRVLIDRETIQRRVRELGAEISRDYANEDLLVVTILKGAAIFAADLLRAITIPVSMEFIEACSYDGTETTAQINIVKGLDMPVTGENVLLVEDIVDTGLTLSFLLQQLSPMRPRTLRVCALLNKPSRRRTEVNVDYLGFSIPNEFVVGYGMDHLGRFRNLPDICIITDHN